MAGRDAPPKPSSLRAAVCFGNQPARVWRGDTLACAIFRSASSMAKAWRSSWREFLTRMALPPPCLQIPPASFRPRLRRLLFPPHKHPFPLRSQPMRSRGHRNPPFPNQTRARNHQLPPRSTISRPREPRIPPRCPIFASFYNLPRPRSLNPPPRRPIFPEFDPAPPADSRNFHRPDEKPCIPQL